MTRKPLLIFDFDGVLCNSIHDSMMTALNTYIRLVPSHRLPLDIPLTPDRVFSFEASHPVFFQQFSDLMPLARRAEDYFLIIGLIEQGETGQISGQSDFDGARANVPVQQLDRFYDAFYETRHRMRESDPHAWSRLFTSFDGIADTIRDLKHRFRFAIVTAKDKKSVLFQLKAFRIKSLFRTEMILDKDSAPSKREAIIALQKKTGIPYTAMHFIDDKVNHLMSVQDLGVRCYLAAWGFNGERERQAAASSGIALLHLNDLPDLKA